MNTRTLIFALAAVLPGFAQMQNNQERTLSCQDNNGGSQQHYCEMREQTIAAGGRLDIDPGKNGGITVKGWDASNVLVRQRIDTSGESDAEARTTASQVRVQISAGAITATGPEQDGHQHWSVSFEIFVPHNTDLQLKAHNGGIRIADVKGDVGFETTNGGVNLQRLAGNVHGVTKNGGLSIELAGARWDGNELNAQTTNGGIRLKMPENYSAHLETSTVNGHIAFDFPMTVSGSIGRQLSTDLGSGGAAIRVHTTNGGVNISRT